MPSSGLFTIEHFLGPLTRPARRRGENSKQDGQENDVLLGALGAEVNEVLKEEEDPTEKSGLLGEGLYGQKYQTNC
jgi:hypothetical protein